VTIFFLGDDPTMRRRCEMCGFTVQHRKAAGYLWYPVPHHANCGKPCMRGGVEPDYVPGTVHDQNCPDCAGRGER
jgi:hypothetical protein